MKLKLHFPKRNFNYSTPPNHLKGELNAIIENLNLVFIYSPIVNYVSYFEKVKNTKIGHVKISYSWFWCFYDNLMMDWYQKLNM